MYFYSGNKQNDAPKNGATEMPSGSTQVNVVQNAQTGASVNQTTNVTPQNVNKKINCSMEVLQHARRDLMGEIEAIMGYDNSIVSPDAPSLAKTTWESIRDEELVHVGELLGLLEYLAPYQRVFVQKGYNEFKERMESK